MKNDLSTRIAPVSDAAPDLRWTPSRRWHLTLAFHGEDEEDRRSERLRTEVAGLAAPTMRLAGSGVFDSGVLWIGVEPRTGADATALAELARRSGADADRPYRPHLTVARWRGRSATSQLARELLAGYAGPWFTPGEAVLLRSEGGEYARVAAVTLTT